ncbi:MAG: hypothetical protein ACOCX1_01905 [Fimbriimonadaceae bacterium]
MPSEAQASRGEQIEAESVTITVGSPNRGDLALVKGGSRVYVGTPVELAFDIFAPPPNATEFSDLPGRLNPEQFESVVWETSSEGFGVIAANVNDVDRVVLAVRSFDRINTDKVREIVSQYRRAGVLPTEEPTIPEISNYDPDQPAVYWFHEEDDQRLMIVVSKNLDQEKMLTIALGDKALMDRLRMDPASAREDYRLASRNLDSESDAADPETSD